MSFFDELKRRNVFRVGIAYAVASWVLLQVLDLVLEHTEAPAWIMDVFFAVVLLGFAVALIIAWAYEVTPEGIKRESEVERDSSVTQHTAKKLDYITLGAVGILIALLVADRLLPGTESAATGDGSFATTTDTSKQEITAEAEPGLERGVAVLPFSNLSEDPNNAFFAGGVHEDVLTHLSRIADLRVISRTSMLKIAERGMDVREMGQYLGVSHVLEGSVRRAGDQVRVTVQLIDASNDVHLWAENFDRELDDIFAIQSEIAQQIANQLEVEMSPEQVEQISEAPTQNLAAYDLFKKAREMARVWRGAEGFKQQLPLLEEAVALDPEFLEAKVDLVEVYGRLVWTNSDPDGTYRQKAKQLTDEIVQKWPGHHKAEFALGNYLYTVERDYEKALARYLTVLPHEPGDSELMLSISSCYKRLGQYDRGLPVIERALSLDPQHPAMQGELGFHLIGNERFDEAIETFRKTTEQFPDAHSARNNFAIFSLRLKGDIDTYFDQMNIINDQDSHSPFLDSQFDRINLANLDLYAKLEQIDIQRDPGNSWANVDIDYKAAELLNLAGDGERSTDRAQRALETVTSLLSAGEPLPGNTPKATYAGFALLACQAGNRGAFNQYYSVFNALEASEIGMEMVANMLIGFAFAQCENPDAGWALIKGIIDPVLGITEWEVALDPIYAHYFSGIPEFQALVKKKNAEKAASK